MLSYLQYLNLPTKVFAAIVIFLVACNLIGEFLELKGKVVPEFIKFRKYFARKKEEREAIAEMRNEMKALSKTMQGMEKLVEDFETHYSSDNIQQRDSWMQQVNQALVSFDDWRQEFGDMLKKNNSETLELKIESMRREILNFASYVVDEGKPVTREQYKRFFNVHAKYEKIIEENKMENGEVDIAYRIVNESYENHLKNHTFIEDIRGY